MNGHQDKEKETDLWSPFPLRWSVSLVIRHPVTPVGTLPLTGGGEVTSPCINHRFDLFTGGEFLLYTRLLLTNVGMFYLQNSVEDRIETA